MKHGTLQDDAKIRRDNSIRNSENEIGSLFGVAAIPGDFSPDLSSISMRLISSSDRVPLCTGCSVSKGSKV